MNFFIIETVNNWLCSSSSTFSSRHTKHLHMHGSKETFVKLNRTRSRFPSHSPDVFVGFSSLSVFIYSSEKRLRWKIDKNKNKATLCFSINRARCVKIYNLLAVVLRRSLNKFLQTKESLDSNFEPPPMSQCSKIRIQLDHQLRLQFNHRLVILHGYASDDDLFLLNCFGIANQLLCQLTKC